MYSRLLLGAILIKCLQTTAIKQKSIAALSSVEYDVGGEVEIGLKGTISTINGP